MKLVDEKGKLFGIINIVDLIVVLLILAIIGAIGYRLMSNKINANGGNILTKEEDVYVTLYSSLITPEVIDSLKEGDKLVANNAYTEAEIVSVERRPALYVAPNSDGNAVLSEHPLWEDALIVVKEKVNPASVVLKVGGQEVRVGYPYILKTQTVETNCKIRGIESETLGKVDVDFKKETIEAESATEASGK